MNRHLLQTQEAPVDTTLADEKKVYSLEFMLSLRQANR